jgi:uncharacterized membrane protein YsdA (DUF1294 family)
MKNIKLLSILLHITCVMICVYTLRLQTGLDFIYGWFIVLNIVVFASFGKDKLSAKMGWRRTPETTFLTLGLFGAFPAILIGRKLFKHKTTKRKFIVPMWGLFIVQLIFATAYLEHVAVKDNKFLAPLIFGESSIKSDS